MHLIRLVHTIGYAYYDQHFQSLILFFQVAIWDTRTGQVINFIHGHTDTVKSVAFSTPTASFASSLLASSGDFTVRISDPRPNQKTDVTCLSPHTAGKEVECVAVSPDSTLLASGGRDNTVVLTTMYMSTAVAETERNLPNPKNISVPQDKPSPKKVEVTFEEEEALPVPEEVLLRSGSVINRDAHRRHSRMKKKGSVEEQFAIQEQLASEVVKNKQKTNTQPQELEGLRTMEEGRSSTSPLESPVSADLEFPLSDRPVSLASSNFYETVIKPSSRGTDTVVITLDENINTDTEEEYEDEGPVSNI